MGDSTELVITVGTSIVLAVLFAVTDAGLEELGEARLHALEERGVPGAKRAVQHGNAIRSRLLLGRVLCIAIASGAGALRFAPSGIWWSLGAALGVAITYGVLAEMGSAVARRRASRGALRVLRWIRPLETLIAPLAWPLVALARLARDAVPEAETESEVATLAMEHVIEQGEEAGEIAEEQAQMLYSVLEFQDTIAREVMVPRTQLVAFDISTSLEQVLELIEESGHSRYPVYRESPDQVEGILYAKDVFRLVRDGGDRTKSIATLLRPVTFVPEAQRIGVLLRQMQASRNHMAVVADEFGGVSGIVTLEDIIEEIVGEIQDEHDDEEPEIEAAGEGVWLVDAAASVFEVQEVIGAKLVEGESSPDFDSVGGMYVHLAGDVPEVGEHVDHEGVRLTVMEADERRVTRLELRRLEPA